VVANTNKLMLILIKNHIGFILLIQNVPITKVLLPILKNRKALFLCLFLKIKKHQKCIFHKKPFIYLLKINISQKYERFIAAI
jgi:hypothetical protein